MVDREDTTATIHSLDLKELFSRGCWQHVIFLTYSFDLPFFETTLLPILEKNGSQFITVVADAEWLAKRLLKWLERGQIHDAGKKYLLCGAKVAGAFHPKVILGVSKTGGAVLVGSGNISTYGMAHGGELFTVLEWQGQQVHPLAREAWELCKRISKDIPTDVRFAQHVDIMANSIFGMLIPPKLRLLWCNLEEPLLPQLIQEIASSAVTDLLLWAPFADRNLVALQELVEQLQPGHVTMALQPKITNIDGRRLEALAASYSSIRWDFVELEQKEPLKHEMMIHAKGILMTLATGEDILLVGSPNLSAPALLQTAQDGNLEVALLLRGRSLLGQLFPENLISLGKPVDLHTLTWRSDMFDDAQTQAKTQVVLLGASMENQTLTLTIAGICPLVQIQTRHLGM